MYPVNNPILRGFNPDPAICKAGDDYFIATSTFEWFPGVRIHQSKDLANWQLVSLPLDRVSQLDMRGVPDSCGIWAPCLSHRDGVFYLIYTVVRFYQGDYKVADNYLVTATDIAGPWSEPTYLNSGCFDPSLFHDDDGRSWYLYTRWDHRREESPSDTRPVKYFNGIMMREFDHDSGKLKDEAQCIYPGTALGMVEGPHIYKIGEYYHLLTAEGGTFHNHAAGFARSKSIFGPYEDDPKDHILKSNQKESSLRRCGHASIAHIKDDEYVLAHLCGRPLPYRGRSVLGRETSIQKLRLNAEQWFEPADGVRCVHEQPVIGMAEQNPQNASFVDDFSGDSLHPRYQFPRVPLGEEHCSVRKQPGSLYLKGQEFIGSLFNQTLIAFRQESYNFELSTKLSFAPRSFEQIAGLTCYYNSTKYVYLLVSAEDDGSRCLDFQVCDNGNLNYPLGQRIALPAQGDIELKFEVEMDTLKAFYKLDGGQWIDTGAGADYSTLSDEYGGENFTGAMLGLACQDLVGVGAEAYFDYLSYQEKA